MANRLFFQDLFTDTIKMPTKKNRLQAPPLLADDYS